MASLYKQNTKVGFCCPCGRSRSKGGQARRPKTDASSCGIPSGRRSESGSVPSARQPSNAPACHLIQIRPQLPRGFLLLCRWSPFLAARAFHFDTCGPVGFSRNRFPRTNPCRCPHPVALGPRLTRFRWPVTTRRALGRRLGTALGLSVTYVFCRIPFPLFRWRCRLRYCGIDSRRSIRRGLRHGATARSVPVRCHRFRRALAIIGQGNHQLPQLKG